MRSKSILMFFILVFVLPGSGASAQPLLGTCCRRDGTCIATTFDGCPTSDPNNLWLGGCGGCQPGVCLIACCALDGSCTTVSPSQCAALGGSSQGSLTSCAPLPACPFTVGSCCYANGTCTVTTRSACQTGTGAAGPGVFQGEGSAGSCNDFCGAPRGACCRAAQCSFLTQAECGEHLWAGPLVTCRAAACCPVDHNTSGTVSVQDIFDFLADYFAGSTAADFNHGCTLTVQDIFDFLAAYFGGCA